MQTVLLCAGNLDMKFSETREDERRYYKQRF